jgi:carotenoid cleavage dioxygenase-like enzyme
MASSIHTRTHTRWEQVAKTDYTMANTAMAPHDFAVTESYYIFVMNQLALDLVPYVTGLKGPAHMSKSSLHSGFVTVETRRVCRVG